MEDFIQQQFSRFVLIVYWLGNWFNVSLCVAQMEDIENLQRIPLGRSFIRLPLVGPNGTLEDLDTTYMDLRKIV